MATIGYLVNEVDAALPFYKALGFRLADRCGPPFAIVKRKGLSLWLSGPGSTDGACRRTLPGVAAVIGGPVPGEAGPGRSGPRRRR